MSTNQLQNVVSALEDLGYDLPETPVPESDNSSPLMVKNQDYTVFVSYEDHGYVDSVGIYPGEELSSGDSIEKVELLRTINFLGKPGVDTTFDEEDRSYAVGVKGEILGEDPRELLENAFNATKTLHEMHEYLS